MASMRKALATAWIARLSLVPSAAGELQDDDAEVDSQRVSLMQSKIQSHTTEKGNLCPEPAAWPERPTKPLQYNGIEWPSKCVEKKSEYHIFLFGDYGGITCGKGNESRDPNGWTCPRSRSRDIFAKTADNTKDHPDRGRHMYHGIDDKAQPNVAKQMQMFAAKLRPDYVLSGGDNFYFGGLDGWGLHCCHPMDSIHKRTYAQFTQVFEHMYAGEGLDIPFYSVFGNHDFGGRMFTAAWDQQIAYTWAEGADVTKRWIMPGFYYSVRINYPGDNFTIDAFMLDTNKGDAKPWTHDPGHNICGNFNSGGSSCSSCGGMPNRYDCMNWFNKLWNDQNEWLSKAMEKSDADWQIITTHFPPDQFMGRYWAEMYVKYGIDLFVGSHRHSQELHLHDRRFRGMSYVVCGGGGGITSEWNPDGGSRGRQQYGFMDVKITKTEMEITSINWAGHVIGKGTVTPRPKQGELSCKHYGCGSKLYWQGCMCSDDCWKHGNCCHDFAATCPQFARCEVWGCNSRWDRRKPCQCTADCDKRGNCCEDHAVKCNATCDNYGCNSERKQWQACQCDADCSKRGDCCHDFAKKCPDLARCEVWGCNSRHDWKKPCQCTRDCEAHGSCCEDHAVKCNPSCDNYGCGSEKKDWQACQCDADCAKRGDCCSDFSKKCPDLARCEVWGCNSRYDHRKPCQCTRDCEARGTCCEDYAEKCKASCENYKCGDGEQWQACSCASDCWQHGNCCPDFSEKCTALAACKEYGCFGKFEYKRPCQCTADCTERGNCCGDWSDVCDTAEMKAARESCAAACPADDGDYPCQARIQYLTRHGKSMADAMSQVNTLCEGKCSCTENVMKTMSLLQEESADSTDDEVASRQAEEEADDAAHQEAELLAQRQQLMDELDNIEHELHAAKNDEEDQSESEDDDSDLLED